MLVYQRVILTDPCWQNDLPESETICLKSKNCKSPSIKIHQNVHQMAIALMYEIRESQAGSLVSIISIPQKKYLKKLPGLQLHKVFGSRHFGSRSPVAALRVHWPAAESCPVEVASDFLG